MQAIVTKTLTNGGRIRIKATAAAGSITIPWDHALNHEQNHCAAALAFASKLKWAGRWIGGFLPDGRGVFTCDEPRLAMVFIVDEEVT
jgi:hypothetical protein